MDLARWRWVVLVLFVGVCGCASVGNARPADGKVLRILPLGDSITQQDDLGYRYHLWKILIDARVKFDFVGSRNIPPGKDPASWPAHKDLHFDCDHEGHAGWTTADLVDGCGWEPERGKLSEWLKTYTPDAVLLHIGTNDAFQSVPLETSVQKIGEIIDLLQAANPKVTIYLAKIIPLGGEWADDYNTGVIALNGQIDGIAKMKTTAASRIVVVDHYTGYDGIEDNADNIHPNDAGARKMAERWAEALLFNGTPIVLEDKYRAVEDQSLEVTLANGILANDYAAGAAMRARLVKPPTNGEISLRRDGGFRYVPRLGFVGTDQFTYKASAKSKTSKPCAVQIDVVGNAPVARPDRYSATQDSMLEIAAADGVLNNDVYYRGNLKAMLKSEPKNGRLVLREDGSFTYTPRASFTGSDTFEYVVIDGSKTSAPVTVDLCVGHAQPIAWWKLDAKDGLTAVDSAGEQHNGSLTNMDANAWTDDGSVRALKFDGKDDYVAVPPLNLNSNTCTITAWVKLDGTQLIFTGIVFSSEADTLAGLGFGSGPAWSPNNELGYFWNRRFWNWHSNLIVPENEWRLVALVVEPEKGTVYLGHDGKIDSAVNARPHNPEGFKGITRIGQNAEKDIRYFKGLIRDVRIYDRSLSADEVRTIVSAR